MKPNIWPKLDEIHQRWLTNESSIDMMQEILLSIKAGTTESLKSVTNEKIRSSSFYCYKRNKINYLNNSFSSTNGCISPRPQTPPTNLYPSKSPRSPRRTLSIDYKKEIHQTRVSGNGSTEMSRVSIKKSVSESSPPTDLTNSTSTRKSVNATSLGSTVKQNAPKRQNQQPEVISDKSIAFPRFFYPKGKAMTQKEVEPVLGEIREKLGKLQHYDGGIPKLKLPEVMKVMDLPLYWKEPFYLCFGGRDSKPLKVDEVINGMKVMLTNCGTDASKFMFIMTRGGLRNFLDRSDFEPLLRDVLETHPGLQFLHSSVDFHVHYINTVIARIFFNLDHTWSDRITLPQLANSDLLWVLGYLEKHSDINMVTQYFSYEHFYVIYCKFWELDDDHNLIISRDDLLRHNNFGLSERIIDRIFMGTVLRKPSSDKTMQYTDFVWFLLAEEDKQHPRSVEYWFRLMDLDGDGILSLYELEYFYQEQYQKMEERGIEPVAFEDCLCMMLDMVKPRCPTRIVLADLKACKLCPLFFNTFFNMQKFMEYESSDPFNHLREIEEGITELSDWDRFASDTYETLMMEDSQQHLAGSSNEYAYEEDFEPDGAGDRESPEQDNRHFLEDIDCGERSTGVTRPGLTYVDRR